MSLENNITSAPQETVSGSGFFHVLERPKNLQAEPTEQNPATLLSVFARPRIMISGEELGPMIFPNRNPERQKEGVSREIKKGNKEIEDTGYVITNIALGSGPAVYMKVKAEDVKLERIKYANQLKVSKLVAVMPPEVRMKSNEILEQLFPGIKRSTASAELLKRIAAAKVLLPEKGETIVDLKKTRREGSTYMRTTLTHAAELTKFADGNNKTIPEKILGLLPIGIPVKVENLTTTIYGESSASKSMNISNRMKEAKALARKNYEVIINVTFGANRSAVYLKFNEEVNANNIPDIGDRQKKKIKLIQETIREERIKKEKILKEIEIREAMEKMASERKAVHEQSETESTKKVNNPSSLSFNFWGPGRFNIREIRKKRNARNMQKPEEILPKTADLPSKNPRADAIILARDKKVEIRPKKKTKTSLIDVNNMPINLDLSKLILKHLPTHGYLSRFDMEEIIDPMGNLQKPDDYIEHSVGVINKELIKFGEIIIDVAEAGEPIYFRTTIEEGLKIQERVRKNKEAAQKAKNPKQYTDRLTSSDFEQLLTADVPDYVLHDEFERPKTFNNRPVRTKKR